ncbi:PREDICTED: protein SERAC1 isoform X2 [Nicrophorus vespilloides]|uniref:Protein SERAC1 n=1 Tax=Nicrophorus vespilloides TaxID=110193 RepID=A0ABM1N9B5_NICVS|nr:PREDICTED: protein SERAC1 isoform X2 [Nicrophorus vespilloides]
MDYFRKNKKIILEISSFLTLLTGSMWIVRKIKVTKHVLNSAFDPSIIEIYEPHQEEIPQPQPYYVTSWMNATYEESKSFLTKTKNFIKFMFARRLLNIAQGDNKVLRMRAIERLAQMELQNWQHSLIAHMCNAKTAVALARTSGTNENFFLPSPRKFSKYSNKMLLHSLKDYMIGLDYDHSHDCVKKTISKVFVDANDISRIIDNEHGSEDLSVMNSYSEQQIPICLETIRHHSIFDDNCYDIVDNNGLYILMEIYNRFDANIKVCIPLCNILANISSRPDIVEELHRSGWIRVLSKWINHQDIRLSGPAGQALANLDRDAMVERFSSNLYLLHPSNRCAEKALVDVVFVHGLLGNVFYTWRNNTNPDMPINLIGKPAGRKDNSHTCSTVKKTSDPTTQEYIDEVEQQLKLEWDALGRDFEFVYYDIPEQSNEEATGPYSSPIDNKYSEEPTQCWAKDWLPNDCSHLRVLGVNYDTTLSVWAQMCPDLNMNNTLDLRSHELIDDLVAAGVGKRPVIWVTHSMGGLLVKNILSIVMQSDNEQMKNLCLNTKEIFFYSTPHCGSKTASFNQPTTLIVWPSIEVQELREGSPSLTRIHKNFMDILNHVPIKVISFVENRPTMVSAFKWNFNPVEPASANPGVGEYYEVPQNHLGICKPTNRYSFLYQKVLKEVKEVVKSVMEESKFKF